MPPGDDDEVTIRGLFEDAISPELQETARAAREAARGLAETGAGADVAAGGMTRAEIAAGRLERQLKDVERATERQRLANMQVMATEDQVAKIRAKGVLTASEAARVEGMLASAHREASAAAKDSSNAQYVLARATDNLGMRFLRTAGSVGFLSTALRGLSLLSTVTMFSSLAGGVTSLGSAGVAALAGLAPLLGTAGAIPALGLAAISAFAGIAMLTSGVMGAVKAMESSGPASAAASSALMKLGPTSARLAYEVYDLTNSLHDVREEAMRNAFPYLHGVLGDVNTMLPVLRRGFIGVTTAVSQTAEEATHRMVGASGDIDLIMRRNATLVRTLGGSVVDALDAGRHIMVGAGPMVQNFADKFAGEMSHVNAELAANPAKVEAFFGRVYDRTMAIVHVVSDFGHGFMDILHAATPLTDHMGAGITGAAAEFREWTGSATGQNRISKFFTDAIPVVDSMVHLVGEIGHSLSDLSSNSDTAGFINGLAAILPPLTALLVMINKVANTVPGANTVLPMLFLANRFGLGPGVLARGGAGIVRGGTLFSRGMRGVEGVEGGFAGRTSQSMIGRLGARIGMRGAAGMAAMGGEEAGAVALGGAGAVEGGGAAAAGLIPLIANPIGLAVVAGVALVGLGVVLYRKWQPFHDMIDSIGRFLRDAFGWVEHHLPLIGHIALGIFAAPLEAAWQIQKHWQGIWGWIKGAAEWVGRMVDKAGELKDSVVHKITHPWEIVGLYTGGPVAPNRPYIVGERGPEIFATAGQMRVVGGDGAELLSSREPGFVLPNEALRAIERHDVRDAASRSFPHVEGVTVSRPEPVPALAGAGRGGGGPDLPPIMIGPYNTFSSDVDVERAVSSAISKWERERRDRR